MAKRRKLPFYAISAVTGLGVEKLKYAIGERVRDLRAESPAVPAAG
jgi:GTP-binding protein